MIHNSELEDINFSKQLPPANLAKSFTDLYLLPQQRGITRAEKKTIAKDCLLKILSRYSVTSTSIHTSKSYARGYIAIAVSDQQVGIDIEQVNKDFNFQETAEACFSKEELQSLTSANAAVFFKNWTRKEAILKAVGAGIIEEIQHIPSGNGAHEIPELDIFNGQKDYYVYTITYADHIISVCSAYPRKNLRFYQIT